MTGKKPDPTKEPAFQKVVKAFLNTPPKPHKPEPDKKKPRSGGAKRG